jgi:hypothetical protein
MAKLKIVLQAEEVVVAESEDPVLWRRVLTTIQGGAAPLGGAHEEERGEDEGTEEMEQEATPRPSAKGAIGKFAAAIGVTPTALVGASEPTAEPPYLVLDAKAWEAFKKNTPPRGPNAVAALQLAGTLLCLWFKYAGINGRPTQAQAAAVLDGLGVVDKNPSRAIKNCPWLQSRPDGIQINPAEMSKAERVAKAFVLKTAPTASE